MAGYSQTPLIKKLGIKSKARIYVKNEPSDYYLWIAPLPADVTVFERLTSNIDFIHLFVTERKVFEKDFVSSKGFLKKDGMLWISWPKKASKVQTDLDENYIREFGLKCGLVDIKVCAVSEVWSGLKFVFRVTDR